MGNKKGYVLHFVCKNCYKGFKKTFKFGKDVRDNPSNVICPNCGSKNVRKGFFYGSKEYQK